MSEPLMIAGTGLPKMPPVVYVPTTAEPDSSQRRVLLDPLDDGRVALFAYTALDRLAELYGQHCDWLLCDNAMLHQIHAQSPFDLILLDQAAQTREAAR